MEKWIVYALVSMAFAGFTSVIAKAGLAGISGELGLAVRTVFVFGFVIAFALYAVPRAELGALSGQNVLWLAASGLTTALSWIFYYKALKQGDVASVVLIDKGSVVVAIVMAWLLLGETITWRILLGAALIVSGLVLIAKR
ncbi:MAG: EamA family transporter [Casimicrobiaceae bacterium]|nr:EamA family transporter [Casimicrobiaceae bacterium]MCX8099038.1 EamA family transporter [Casimicrobiaceae bacterium]MDW8312898.1 EamA family transporter [Burkholderiales bacterium]